MDHKQQNEVINQIQYFILLKDIDAFLQEPTISVRSLKQKVFAGSLGQSSRYSSNIEKYFITTFADIDIKQQMCIEKSNVGLLSKIEYKLLLAVTTYNERLQIYKTHKKTLENTAKIKCLPEQRLLSNMIPLIVLENSSTKLSGHLKYIGKCRGKVGLWLGVELDHCYNGKVFDTKEVIYNNEPLFLHKRNHGILINIQNILYPEDFDLDKLCEINTTNQISSPIIKSFLNNDRKFLNNLSHIKYNDQHITDRNYNTVPAMKLFSPEIKKNEYYNDNQSYEQTNYLTVPIQSNKNKQNKESINFQDIFKNNLPLEANAKNHSIKKKNSSTLSSEKLYSNTMNSDLLSSNIPKLVDNLGNNLKSCDRSKTKILSNISDNNLINATPPLKIGERVVWISDEGIAEYASVMWIGVISSYPKQYTVGVEFDNPVGTGTGRYQNQDLFRTHKNHASLIPAIGLIKASEFNSSDSVKDEKVHISSTQQSEDVNIDFQLTSLSKDDERPFAGLASLDSGSTLIPLAKSTDNSLDSNIDSNTSDTNTLIYISRGADVNADSNLNETISKSCNLKCEINMLIEIDISSKVYYGVIRWIGEINKEQLLGIELETDCVAGTDGRFGTERFFTCPPKRGYFTRSSTVRIDSRFKEPEHLINRSNSGEFGSLDCRELTGYYTNLNAENIDDLLELLDRSLQKQNNDYSEIGLNLGIQGHHNSCYLDATLFSMFAFSSTFDFLMHRPFMSSDINSYKQVQAILKDAIVNPLRCNLYVRADRILKLRKLLSEISNIPSFQNEEKDPEELLNVLLIQALNIQPFFKLSSGYTGILYQLIVENKEIELPTTQQLLHLSLSQSQIKFKEVPNILMLQMPRFGCAYQVYRRILPSLTIHLDNFILQDVPECCFCGKQPDMQCVDCVADYKSNSEFIFFCTECFNRRHMHEQRRSHTGHAIRPSSQSDDLSLLHLFAVICIQTSHYVSFVRCGETESAPWVFFDSMADRIGSCHGYNVPRIKPCEYIPDCLVPGYDVTCSSFSLSQSDDKCLPEEVRRFLSDSHICMYRSATLQAYR